MCQKIHLFRVTQDRKAWVGCKDSERDFSSQKGRHGLKIIFNNKTHFCHYVSFVMIDKTAVRPHLPSLGIPYGDRAFSPSLCSTDCRR